MSEIESKSIVVSIRLSPATMDALTRRATADRRPVRTMAAMLIEDALAKPRLAHAAPLAATVRPIGADHVQPNFKPSKAKKS